MRAEDRTKCAVLEPSHIDFLVRGIVGVSTLKASDVGGPVGKPRHRVVKPSGNLAAQRREVGSDVSGPRGRGVALLSDKCRAREDEHTMLFKIGRASCRE